MLKAMQPPTLLDPVAPEARLEAIDTLRGFALFGILLVNMLLFSDPGYYETFMMRLSQSGVDRYAELFILTFAQGAFYPIFSFLFGLGFSLQLLRRGEGISKTYRRRLWLLLGIGVFHSLFIWSGDILVTYAISGFVLMQARSTPDTRLLRFGLGGILFTFVVYTLSSLAPSEAMTRYMDVYSSGSYLQVTLVRLEETLLSLFSLPFIAPQILALFFAGLYAGRRRVFENLEREQPLLHRMLFWGLLIGLGGKGLHAYDLLTEGFGSFPTAVVGSFSSIISGSALGFAYMSALCLALCRPGVQRRLTPLAAVGRTALSNYLLQSLVFTVLFYGYGFGLYGRMGAAAGVGLVLSFYALQVPLSVLWLRHFRYGLAEWLWRSLTYGQWQPLRLQQAAPQRER